MKKEDIKELMAYFDETGSSRLKIKDGEFEIELEKYSPASACPTPVVNIPAPAPAPSAPININVNSSEKPSHAETLNSPMVGTFYEAPSPGAPAFAKPGQSIRKGETIGIIEAMKIMNEIEAEFDCRIIKSLVNDGQPVEFGMALFEVEKL